MMPTGDGPNNRIRQVPSSDKEKRLEQVDKLLQEIGIYDTGGLPPDYVPPQGSGSSSILIKGGRGSHWLNRLSALTLLLVLTVLGAGIFGIIYAVKSIRTERAPTEISCEAQILDKPPVLRDMANVARGRVIVPAKTGQVSIDPVTRARTNLLATKSGQMKMVTSRDGVLERLDVIFNLPPGICAGLQATGLLDKGMITLSGKKIEGASEVPDGWTASIVGTIESVMAVRLDRVK